MTEYKDRFIHLCLFGASYFVRFVVILLNLGREDKKLWQIDFQMFLLTRFHQRVKQFHCHFCRIFLFLKVISSGICYTIVPYSNFQYLDTHICTFNVLPAFSYVKLEVVFLLSVRPYMLAYSSRILL